MTIPACTVIISIAVWQKDDPAVQNSTVWYTGITIRTCRHPSGTITAPTVSITRLTGRLRAAVQQATAWHLPAPLLLPHLHPLIGSYATAYNPNISRAVNVSLAASRINGMVIQPGESFSFNQAILPRTSANGYVEASMIVNKKFVPGIGGGICQVSSTLYAAMLSAGLPATERHPHSLRVTYIPEGMDATISGNTLDLRFTNIFAEPIQIQASADQGTLTVSLYKL